MAFQTRKSSSSAGHDAAGLIERRFKESADVLHLLSLDAKAVGVVAAIAREISKCLKAGGRVVVFGNGGSAADAQHFAGELVGGYTNHNRRALDVIALSTNTSNLTAIGNDYHYDEVFSRQVEAHCKKGDIAVGISTSGNSKNVLEAMKVAKKLRVLTVGFTGASGGKLKDLAQITFQAPSDSTPRIQEAHINAIHSICELVEKTLFPNGGK
ncbi:MAG: D-sedoheptulose 7-phosphate isomerase [Elusimicrobia bacterium]|nr:D-sedoheptulose 7-phosphate isomerase [Elusimicrobiota bacterium]